MCGIAGCWTYAGGRDLDLGHQAGAMAETLAHRGPDDRGVWVDGEAGIALGFRRLAILDLSPTGRQPMTSSDGRYVIVFNGEIYNFLELRAELERDGCRFRGTSDTEVILESFVLRGVPATIARVWGMFAIAVWDRVERRLILARDRIGKKPLYYATMPGLLLFASELKALRSHQGFRASLDRDSLASYLRFGYVPAPGAIYRDTFKVPPGSFAVIEAGRPARIETYWRALDAAVRGHSEQRGLTEPDARQQLETLLRDSVRRRMIADVPVGAFLSGGLDSSTIVALMQAESTSAVHTFTVGFPVAGYNEAEAAKAVASRLGTDHTELYVTPQQALDTIPRLPEMYDEPFADSSQIPACLVSALARRQVTVSLSGDGGDELFGGYTRYQWAPRIWRRMANVPAVVRGSAAAALSGPSPGTWDRWYALVAPLMPAGMRQTLAGDKIHKMANLLGVASPDALYRGLVSQWHSPDNLVLGGRERGTALDDPTLVAKIPEFVDRMMYLDLVSYLPDDILVKVDRASMAASLEVRAPLLDHRLVEWSWSVPRRFTSRKRLLREVLYRYVPRALVDRPKMGFAVPIDAWLRDPLRDWAEDLLNEDRLRRDGLFDPAPIRHAWRQHLSGERNEQHRLWTILMFQAWHDRWSTST